MNRWSRWTRQLRARHGRTDRGVSRAGMVFQRRSAAAASLLLPKAGSKIHIHIYPRMGITLAAVAATPLSAMRPAPHADQVYRDRSIAHLSTAAYVRQQAMHVPQRQAQGPERAIEADRVRATETTFIRTLPAFLPAHLRRTLEPEPSPVFRIARVITHQPSTTKAATDLPARLRLRSRREEHRQPEAPRVMVLPSGRAGIIAPANYATQPARVGLEPVYTAPPATPAVPAINVEALTSQVIQQLDRRLIAYRERLGRA